MGVVLFISNLLYFVWYT